MSQDLSVGKKWLVDDVKRVISHAPPSSIDQPQKRLEVVCIVCQPDHGARPRHLAVLPRGLRDVEEVFEDIRTLCQDAAVHFERDFVLVAQDEHHTAVVVPI